MKQQRKQRTKTLAPVVVFPEKPAERYRLGYLKALLKNRRIVNDLVAEEVERLSELATPEQAELLALLCDREGTDHPGGAS